MVSPIDLTGERFGRLVVVAKSHVKQGNSYWLCRCDCGAETYPALNNLRRGLVTSCGCLRKEVTSARSRTHGEGAHSTREYRVWAAMKRRCLNPKVLEYKNYGARGISVCDRWLRSFEAFLADMGRCPPNLTLERVNNDGNYDPLNCKWATRSEQNLNTRRQAA